MGPPPLTWHAFFHVWHLNVDWLVLCAFAGAGYIAALARAHRLHRTPVHPVRIVSFLGGLTVLSWCMCSAIGTYAMALFWVHMIEHLTLITVVPALLVLGHPLTVLRCAGRHRWQRQLDRVVRHGPGALLTHPGLGLAVYATVIFYTHLTPFMDRMSAHPWLMTVEQIAYVASGYMLLIGTIGEEPIRWHTPYLLRLVILILAMVPDTLVGIVLLQTPTVPFPRYMATRPTWATPGLHDLDIGGALMWAAGDALMMALALGLVVSLLTGRTRDRMLGPWLESVRTNTLRENLTRTGTDLPREASTTTIDDDQTALDAYNEMLRRLAGREPT